MIIDDTKNFDLINGIFNINMYDYNGRPVNNFNMHVNFLKEQMEINHPTFNYVIRRIDLSQKYIDVFFYTDYEFEKYYKSYIKLTFDELLAEGKTFKEINKIMKARNKQ